MDTALSKSPPGVIGCEIRVKTTGARAILLTAIGADEEDLKRLESGVMNRRKRGNQPLANRFDLPAIINHHSRFWDGYRIEEERVNLVDGDWTNYLIPFSESDYPEEHKVREWFLFLCFPEDVVAKRETVSIEIASPVLVIVQP